MFNETSHSLCVVVHEHLLPCCGVVTAKWVVSCTRITRVQPLSRCSLTLHTSSFISGSGGVVFSLSPPFFSFHRAFFLFYLWFIGHFVPAQC